MIYIQNEAASSAIDIHPSWILAVPTPNDAKTAKMIESTSSNDRASCMAYSWITWGHKRPERIPAMCD